MHARHSVVPLNYNFISENLKPGMVVHEEPEVRGSRLALNKKKKKSISPPPPPRPVPPPWLRNEGWAESTSFVCSFFTSMCILKIVFKLSSHASCMWQSLYFTWSLLSGWTLMWKNKVVPAWRERLSSIGKVASLEDLPPQSLDYSQEYRSTARKIYTPCFPRLASSCATCGRLLAKQRSFLFTAAENPVCNSGNVLS